MSLIIDVFICRSDNYGYLAHDSETGKTAAIDAPDAAAIRSALAHRGWTLSDIFITHHHADHTDGIAALRAELGVTVTGPREEAEKIDGLDVLVEPGESVMLGSVRFEVLGAPGHTLGHIVYHNAAGHHLFSGDALFSLGCGRMFEGTAGPMWDGLAALRELPEETLIFCGHEYTLANAKFATSIDPKNPALRLRAAEVQRLRDAGRFTIPVTMAMERATNPFLRADQPDMAAAMRLPAGVPPSVVFAAIRKAKDNFKAP